MAEIEKDEVVEDEGTTTEDVNTEDTDTTVETADTEVEVPEFTYCNGFFGMYPTTDFTQHEKYSDTYLKSKNLFKEETSEEE